MQKRRHQRVNHCRVPRAAQSLKIAMPCAWIDDGLKEKIKIRGIETDVQARPVGPVPVCYINAKSATTSEARKSHVPN